MAWIIGLMEPCWLLLCAPVFASILRTHNLSNSGIMHNAVLLLLLLLFLLQLVMQEVLCPMPFTAPPVHGVLFNTPASQL
jgi:hypothetical protein